MRNRLHARLLILAMGIAALGASGCSAPGHQRATPTERALWQLGRRGAPHSLGAGDALGQAVFERQVRARATATRISVRD